MRGIKNFRILITVVMLVVAAVILLSLVRIFQATPPNAPLPSMALSKPRTIGVLFVRQSADAIEGIKAGLQELGYTNITFKEVLLDSQTTIEDVQDLTKKLVGEKIDLMVAPLEDLPNGGHFGYGGDFSIAGKQVARMADKIFRGAKPRDIPLEYVEKTSLVVYPVRARLAGVEFPGSVLEIADKVVDDR
ncbi:MAG: ABC transporter substrate binding protein [Patescibacteria group bacterium]